MGEVKLKAKAVKALNKRGRPAKVPRKKWRVKVPVKPESLNEFLRYDRDRKDLGNVKREWEKLFNAQIREAQNRGDFPQKINARITVELHVYFDIARTRDEDNYFYVAKGAIDAINALGIIPDDNSTFVNFGGIYFHKAKDGESCAEIEVMQSEGLERIEEASDKKNLLSIVSQSVKQSESALLNKYTYDQIMVAYFFSWPRTFRPTMQEIGTALGKNSDQINLIKRSEGFENLLIELVKKNAFFDLPDVMESVKMNATAGNIGAQRLFLEYLEQIKNVGSIVNNNIVIVSNEDTRAKIAELQSAYAKEPKSFIDCDIINQ